MFILLSQENRVVNLSLVVSYYWQDDEKESLELEMVNGDILLATKEEIAGVGLPLPE